MAKVWDRGTRDQEEGKAEEAEVRWSGGVGGQEEKNVIESMEVVFLWLHFLLKLELDRFFGQILIFSMGKKWIWVMIIDEVKIQVLDNYKRGL